ncbi:MAG: chorismate synthase [Negativicutes bacterium]|nr:chorismate synthase [Negativicutes bacterium]
MFRFLTAGESHGPCLTAVIEGLPAGLALDIEIINYDLERRQRGYGRGGRMQIERDRAEVLSGVRFGQTLGGPVTLAIRNRDWANWEQRMSPLSPPTGEAVRTPRPGHADLTGVQKYDRQDVRDILERASARETAARVAVGAVAKTLLSQLDIDITSHVVSIGGIRAQAGNLSFAEIKERRDRSDLGCADPVAEASMKAAIDAARERGDTLGGVFEVWCIGLMPGLGSYVQWDRRLDTRLAGAIMSIPAIKGVEIGDGFLSADKPGSTAHDEIYLRPDKGIFRPTNRAGGLEGGMTNGEPVVVRAAMKPIPTLMQPLTSIDIKTFEPAMANTERSDVCAVPAAAVVGEAMIAIILAQAVLEKFGGDNLTDLLAGVSHYRRRIGG